MQSTEQSGVGAKGFRVANARAGRKTGGLTALLTRLGEMVASISPITTAVATTALIAATLFVMADALMVIEASFAQTEAAQRRPSSDLSGVLVRGLGAYSVALLAITLTIRRRPRLGLPAGTERQRYEDLIATVPFGVACWTPNGELLVCNERYNAQLDDDGPDQTPGASYHESIKRLIQGGYMKLLREDDSHRQLELHRADGSCLLIDERPLQMGGYVTLVTDVTERRQAELLLASIREEQRQLARRYHEEKLRAEAASRSKTAFMAHLSHDIRTPLNHIIGFADLIRHQTFGPIGDARYLGYVDTIKGSGERLLGFFGSILDLAELEGGQRELRQEQFGADDLLEEVARRFRSQATHAGLALSLGAACGATLAGDRFCLDRMVGNLLENALRFTPSGGKISLAAYAAADGVVLEIADTGIGMSADRLSALSQPFAYADATFAKETGGAGLGIPIARAIAELSGGRLAIDSRPGLGTTVAVSLPLVAAAQEHAAE
jgi:two-component system cell cycle sensor histidine kinase PleC